MASLAPTTSSPNPQAGDCHSGMTNTGAHGDTSMQHWIGGLPPELWLCILDYLCPHCHVDPPLKSGAVFEKSYYKAITTEALPRGSRGDLISMTWACRGLRDLAQPYVFHCFDKSKQKLPRADAQIDSLRPADDPYSPLDLTLLDLNALDLPSLAGPDGLSPPAVDLVADKGSDSQVGQKNEPAPLIPFRRAIFRRPDLARAVREMTASSTFRDRVVLSRLGNIRTLNFWIYGSALGHVKYKSKLVGDLENLSHLVLRPAYNDVVDIAKGRLWLENLMKAAPKLRKLRCYRFTDFSYKSPAKDLDFPPRDASFDYAGLPENKINRLELLTTWFRFHSLKQLLQNFKSLREFRHSHTKHHLFNATDELDDETMRPVDGHDVVTLLKPLRKQLEMLELDFNQYPQYQSGLRPFRPIGSLAGFSALKTVRLSQMSIGELPGLHSDIDVDMPDDEEYYAHLDGVRAATKDFFVNFLPCRSLQSLQIDHFDELFDLAVVELARHAGRGELPRLKHVRLLGVHECDLKDFGYPEDQLGRYHDLESLVPERSRGDAKVRQAMCWEDRACEAEDLFHGAGVLFERTQLSWPEGCEAKSEDPSGRMVMYPQPICWRM